MDRKVDALGPTGLRVAARMHRLRRDRGLTLGQLADRLVELGRPIALAALSKIEKGQRRVDADDLVALALALDAPPNELLFPARSEGEVVELTPLVSKPSHELWSWASRDLARPGKGVFISYAGADRSWAEWIGWTLIEAGAKVTLDVWDLAPGDSTVDYVNQAMTDAAFVVAVVSDAYFQSEWTQPEWTAALPRMGGPRLIPVCVQAVEMPAILRSIRYVDLVGVPEAEARASLLRALGLASGQERGAPEPPPFPR